MIRCLAAPLLVVLSMLGPPAASAGSIDPPPLVVDPSTDLTDGQLVALDATVVVPGEILPVGIELLTCLDDWAAGTSRPCNRSSFSPLFAFSMAEGRVARFVETDDGMTDCATTACSLVYTKTSCVSSGFPFGTCALIESRSVEAAASFRPGRGMGTSGDWTDGATLRIAATQMVTGSPAVAFAVQCAFLHAGGIACGPTGSVEPEFDGEFDGTIEIEERFTQGGTAVDCTIDLCVVGVVVLGAGYHALDGLVTYRVWGEPG